MQVASLEAHEALAATVTELAQQVAELHRQLPAWVGQHEAERLSGYSRSWFVRQRKAGTLPIPYRKDGPRTLLYDRAACVALGRQNLVHPPAWAQQQQTRTQQPHSL